MKASFGRLALTNRTGGNYVVSALQWIFVTGNIFRTSQYQTTSKQMFLYPANKSYACPHIPQGINNCLELCTYDPCNVVLRPNVKCPLFLSNIQFSEHHLTSRGRVNVFLTSDFVAALQRRCFYVRDKKWRAQLFHIISNCDVLSTFIDDLPSWSNL